MSAHCEIWLVLMDTRHHACSAAVNHDGLLHGRLHLRSNVQSPAICIHQDMCAGAARFWCDSSQSDCYCSAPEAAMHKLLAIATHARYSSHQQLGLT